MGETMLARNQPSVADGATPGGGRDTYMTRLRAAASDGRLAHIHPDVVAGTLAGARAGPHVLEAIGCARDEHGRIVPIFPAVEGSP